MRFDGFSEYKGKIMLTKQQLQKIAPEKPLYVYDKEIIQQQCTRLKETFADFTILFSIKANPFSPLITSMRENGLGSDSASSEEVQRSLAAGFDKDTIYYSTPGKTKANIEAVLGSCHIVADSIHELQLINTVASEHHETIAVGIRVNPPFSIGEDKGSASKFGIDYAELEQIDDLMKDLPHISIQGIHIHLRSQILDAALLGKYYKNCFQLAKNLQKHPSIQMQYINFGGGIGTVYNTQTEKSLDLHELTHILNEIQEDNKQTIKAQFIVESGRFLTAQAGTFYTPIVDIKESHETHFLVVKNGLNGFLRPSLAHLIQTIAGTDIRGFEPLYTENDAFTVSLIQETENTQRDKQKVTIVGSLCTSLDVIKDNVLLPKAHIGDYLAISNAGSYGYSLSPLLFASHEKPLEILL